MKLSLPRYQKQAKTLSDNYRPVLVMNIDEKFYKQNFSKSNLTIYQKVNASLPNGVYPHNARLVSYLNSSQYSSSYKQTKMKNRMIISMHAEKTLDRIQYLFLIKTLSNLGLQESFLSLMKGEEKRLNSAGLGYSDPAHSQERPISMTTLCPAPEN